MDVAASHAQQLPANPARSLGLSFAAVAAATLTAIAGALGAAAETSDPTMAAALRATMVAAPLGAALYAWRMAPFQRFARILAAVGLVAFLTTLAESTDGTLYSIGRAAGWTMELLLVALLLAFPHGPLRDRDDRRLVGAMAVVVAVFYLPTLLLTDHFQVPSPYTSCTHDCPPNVLFPGDHELPGAGEAFLGAGSVFVLVVMAWVLARLYSRVAAASSLQRRALTPVLTTGVVRATLVGSVIVLRQAGGDRGVVTAGAMLIAWLTPAIPIAFVAGLVRVRLASERTLRGLADSVRAAPDPAALQQTVATAFDDPTLVLTLPRDGDLARWVDIHGDAVASPLPTAGRCLRFVRDDHGRAVGALTADAALADRPQMLDAAIGLVAMAIERRSLEQEARQSAREARASRGRLAATADAERRRLERDLHDGAQQRLVALRIELGLVEDLVHDDPAAAAARIRELEASADEALEELRSLAHGVRPPLLADRGVAEALRAAIARSTVPAALTARRVARYPPEVESAVYFTVLEALQNVGKHARGASKVTVVLDGGAPGELSFEVRDDGPGADRAALDAGAGVTNMRDRVAAVNGSLRIVSIEGAGTLVAGRLPVGAAPAAVHDA